MCPIKAIMLAVVCHNIYLNKGNVNECRTALVKNLIKESFYGKRKKKQLMF